MDTPFVSDALAAKVKRLNARAFLTVKKLGDALDISLLRDSDQDGSTVAVPPQNVLVVFARREAGVVRQGGAVYAGADGELRKEEPFDVQAGDSFRLEPSPGQPAGAVGASAVITIVLPPENGVIRAPFTLRG